MSITYKDGPACLWTGAPTSFTINTWCNSTLAAQNTSYDGQATGDPCNPVINIYSSVGGCDLLQNSIIWEYLDYAKPYFGAIGIVVGLMLAFYGLRLLKPSICIAGFLTCTMLTLLVFYAVYAQTVDQLATFYYWMAGGAAVGVVCGVIMAKFVKVGGAILAAWGGFALGLILNEAFMYRFQYSWVFWTTNGVCMVVCAALAFKFLD